MLDSPMPIPEIEALAQATAEELRHCVDNFGDDGWGFNIAMAQDCLLRAFKRVTQAELAALREPMACGHPKACWVEDKNSLSHLDSFYRRQIDKGMFNEDQVDSLRQDNSHCSACAQQEKAVRLAVAAALREAARAIRGIPRNEDSETAGALAWAASRVELFLEDSDCTALDAHDAEVRDRALEEVLRNVRHLSDYQIGAIRALKSGGSK